MTHVVHLCPAIKCSDISPHIAAYLATEEIAINLDAHKEYTTTDENGRPADSGERHCPYCGADIKKAKPASQEWLEVLGAIEGQPAKKIPKLTSHEILRKKFGVKA